MNHFTKRLLIFGVLIAGFTTFAFALSQAVIYKPWGVPDSRRDDYDNKLAEIDHKAELREEYKNKPKPKASTSQPLVDFGWVRPGEKLEHRIYIKNDGNAELTVKIRGTSNDALMATLDRKTLQPGDEAECAISLVATSEPDAESISETITVLTNDPFRSALSVRVKYQPRKALILPPRIGFESHDFGEASSTEFLVYSQLGQQFEVVDISNEAYDIRWVATPEELTHEGLDGKSATSANRVRLEIEPKDYGRFEDELDVTVKIDGVEHHSKLAFGGRVKPPIGFYGPKVDSRNGIDFGTVESGTRHDLFVVVRSRADKSRPIEVLGVEPKELETELTPLATEGSYRLRISIPADCSYKRFNLAQQHGYVHIGDPKMENYSSWLPVYGCVGDFKAD